MILADKIIKLRKQNGWSQEEMAEKLHVSRQAVSKWESAQAIPDLEKILGLASLFGVTTDYLLKEEMEDEEYTDSVERTVRRVTLTEANDYLAWRNKAALRIALGVLLCIVAAIPLIFLSVAAESLAWAIPMGAVASVGIAVLLVTVAVAVSIFVLCGFQNAPYSFLDSEPFETEYGVDGLVREKQRAWRPVYVKCNVVGICLCLLSPVPLIIASFLGNELCIVSMVCVLLAMVAFGVFLLVMAGVRWASMECLLCEGEFAAHAKRRNKKKEAVESLYWLIAVAVYLGWSFLSGDWHITWVVWPVAALLSAGIDVVFRVLGERDV